MKRILLLLIVLFPFVGLLNAQTFLNLDFEKSKNGQPDLWSCKGEGYKITSDSIVFYSGKKSVCIEKTGEGTFGLVVKRFPLEEGKDKKLVFSGYIKTQNITEGFAGLWWRVDGAAGTLAFDNMADRGPSGTTDWTKYTIELSIDADATGIVFGVLLPGDGKAWFDKLQIELDGKPYADIMPATK